MEKMHSDDESGKFDLAALVVSKREREREREREKKTKRDEEEIYYSSLSVVVIISSRSTSVKILFLRYTNTTHGFLSPKEEKTQILLLVGKSWKSVADETVRGGEIRETSIIRSRRAREDE